MPGYTEVDWKTAWAGQLQALVRRPVARKGPRTARVIGWHWGSRDAPGPELGRVRKAETAPHQSRSCVGRKRAKQRGGLEAGFGKTHEAMPGHGRHATDQARRDEPAPRHDDCATKDVEVAPPCADQERQASRCHSNTLFHGQVIGERGDRLEVCRLTKRALSCRQGPAAQGRSECPWFSAQGTRGRLEEGPWLSAGAPC